MFSSVEIINTEFKIYDLNKELLYSKNLADDLDEIYDDNYVYYFEYFDIVDNNLIVQYGYDIESPKGLNTVLNNKDIYGRAAIINNKGELSKIVSTSMIIKYSIRNINIYR